MLAVAAAWLFLIILSLVWHGSDLFFGELFLAILTYAVWNIQGRSYVKRHMALLEQDAIVDAAHLTALKDALGKSKHGPTFALVGAPVRDRLLDAGFISAREAKQIRNGPGWKQLAQLEKTRERRVRTIGNRAHEALLNVEWSARLAGLAVIFYPCVLVLLVMFFIGVCLAEN